MRGKSLLALFETLYLLSSGSFCAIGGSAAAVDGFVIFWRGRGVTWSGFEEKELARQKLIVFKEDAL